MKVGKIFVSEERSNRTYPDKNKRFTEASTQGYGISDNPLRLLFVADIAFRTIYRIQVSH